jgi:hypothetical protein
MKVTIDSQEVFELAEWMDKKPTMFIIFHKLRCWMKARKVYGLHVSDFANTERVLRLRRGELKKFIEKLDAESPAFFANDCLGIPEVLKQFQQMSNKCKHFTFVNVFNKESFNEVRKESINKDPDTDHDQDQDQDPVSAQVRTSSPFPEWPPPIPPGDALEKYLPYAYRYFEKPQDQLWTKKNAFIQLGRQPLKKYENVWMTPRTLATAFKEYHDLKIDQKHWAQALQYVKSRIETEMITAGSQFYQRPENYDSGMALIGWAKDKLLESLVKMQRYEQSNSRGNASRAELESNRFKFQGVHS